MDTRRIRTVVVGGGTAGWMTAAALATLASANTTVQLVESAEIGIVGVGEATLPHLRAFIERLGIDEAEFMAATQATFKLGIAFHDFGRIGERYFHPFGNHGRELAGIAFHHFWLRQRSEGSKHPIGDYAMGAAAAAQNRFRRPAAEPDNVLESFGYAYHFDATRFAPFLRQVAEARGAVRTQGRIMSVHRDAETGAVRSLQLEDGTRIEGDLFIDCSGFRGLLIGDEPSGWQDWSHWLPCDRAVAMPCASPAGSVEPFTRAVAMPAGWRWRIPLQERIGNGYVYSSAHVEDGVAEDALVAALEGAPLADPRRLRFRAGRRTRSWSGNVVAIGLASGFLEPLESTSIYLVQAAITQLLEHFPGGHIASADRDGFNLEVDREYDRIRDFLILHYHATTRDDSPFWEQVRAMPIPDSLEEKLTLWRRTARVARYRNGLFLEPSWVAVLLGQGVVPDGWDPRANLPAREALGRATGALRDEIARTAAAMPDHRAALAQQALTGAARA